jgi:hypothetical protein
MALSTLTDTERHQRAQPVCAWCMELQIAPFELDNSPCDTITAERWQLAGFCGFRTGWPGTPQTSASVVCQVGQCLTGTPPLTPNPCIDVDWHDSPAPSTHRGLLRHRGLRTSHGQRPPFSTKLARACGALVWGASIMASAPPAASGPRHSTSAPGQSVGEDSDRMRRGHPWRRRAARRMLSARGSHRRKAW